MPLSSNYRRRLQIWKTNFGRDAGWYVEWDGTRIAALVDCQFFEMFWESYRIVPIKNELGFEEAQLHDKTFWKDLERFTFRNRTFNEIAAQAFPATDPFTENGRIVMRELYLDIGLPNWWDRLVMRWATV